MWADRRFRLAFATLLLALFSFAWLGLQAYQSHYVSGLRVLGDQTTTSLVGEPKAGRGDEWSTYLPLLKQAYQEGFPARSSLEPYRERFDWFITLPHAGASLLLLPNQAAYWVMPAGMALSFQGLYYNLLLLLSVFWLLRNLKIAPWLSMAAGIALLFSHLYQVWWTSNFACLGASILPFAVLTSTLRWRCRGPLLAWSIAHMLLGQLYPPFYFSLAVAVLPFIAAARVDLLHWRNLAYAAICVVAGCVAVLHFKLGYIEAVSGTTYPGLRFSTGADTTASTLMGVLFPTWPATSTFDVGASFYELSMAGSYFTLLAVAALPTVAWTKEVRRVVAVSAAVALVLVIYMLFGFPEALAKATGFFMAPGRRIQLGFSVLVLFLSVYLVSRTREPIRAVPLLVAFGAYALVSHWVGVRPDLEGQFAGIRWYPYLGFALLCVAGAGSLLLMRGKPAGKAMVVVLVSGMSIAHVVVFGSFNPVMRASDIMRPVDTQLVRDWKALHRMNHGRPLAVVGNYGHLLRGEGLEALEAIHLKNTDDDIYARVFPEVRESDRHRVFNQFLGITFDNVPGYRAYGVVATFPVSLHSVAFPHVVDAGRRGAIAINGPVQVADVERRDVSRFIVHWNSKLQMPLPISARLVLHPKCKVYASWMTRYPTGGARLGEGRVALRGIAGQLVLGARSAGEAAACAQSLLVSSPDGVPVESPLVKEDDGAGIRAGLAWSGKACDLNARKQQLVDRELPALLRGFVIAPSSTPAGAFEIVLAGGHVAYGIAAKTGVARPDVAGYFGIPGLAGSGFRVAVDFSGMPAGAYAVEFHGVEGGNGWFCESGKTIIVP